MATTISETQLKMLSNIFRLIAKEITTDEDKENLAPGEIGISYKEGAFYIRNPHTGELFSPNSVEHIEQILSKWDSTNELLDSDSVNGVRFYSSIAQLSQLGISLSMDSIIRQMTSPSILMSKVEYTNYGSLGFPSSSGTVLVYKVNEEFVISSYYDNRTYSTYDGRYNYAKHLFEGWAISGTAETSYVELTGDGNMATITLDKTLNDLDVITVRVTTDLAPGATISYNGGTYKPIIMMDGTALNTTITSNNIIMLINDERQNGWILVQSTESSLASLLKMLSNRIGAVEKNLTLAISDYNSKINDLKTYIDSVKARPGNIITYTSTYSPAIGNADVITTIDNYNSDLDRLIVNFNQTILREGIDYTINGKTGILFTKIRLNTTDVVQLIVIKQEAV